MASEINTSVGLLDYDGTWHILQVECSPKMEYPPAAVEWTGVMGKFIRKGPNGRWLYKRVDK